MKTSQDIIKLIQDIDSKIQNIKTAIHQRKGRFTYKRERKFIGISLTHGGEVWNQYTRYKHEGIEVPKGEYVKLLNESNIVYKKEISELKNLESEKQLFERALEQRKLDEILGDSHEPSDNTAKLNNENVVSENAKEKELLAYLSCSKNENTTYCTIFMDKYYSFCGEKITNCGKKNTNENALKKTLQFYGLYNEEKFESNTRAFYKKNKPPKPQRRKSQHTSLKNKKVNQVHQ